MTKKPPVVQARALETRAKILAQAEKAFASNGFDGTSLTSDILEPAGVSVGSFYHQFDNKRDVLFAVFNERMPTGDEIAQRVLAPDRESFADGLRHVLLGLCDDIDHRPETWWLQYRERLSPDRAVRAAVSQRWTEWLEVLLDAMRRWYHVPDDVAETVGAATLRTVNSLVRDYLISGHDDRARLRDEAVTPTVTFCVAGLERLLADAGGGPRT